jgi:hypothetical protein
MLLEILDFSKITGIFGLEVCILVGRFSLSIFSMKVLCTGKYMRESLSSSLLVTGIVTGANDSSSTLGANYSAGLISAADILVAPTKYPLVATTDVAADATDTCDGTCPWLGGGRAPARHR